MKMLIGLTKQMEGMREERNDVACDETQQCWHTACPNFKISASILNFLPASNEYEINVYVRCIVL